MGTEERPQYSAQGFVVLAGGPSCRKGGRVANDGLTVVEFSNLALRLLVDVLEHGLGSLVDEVDLGFAIFPFVLDVAWSRLRVVVDSHVGSSVGRIR